MDGLMQNVRIKPIYSANQVHGNYQNSRKKSIKNPRTEDLELTVHERTLSFARPKVMAPFVDVFGRFGIDQLFLGAVSKHAG